MKIKRQAAQALITNVPVPPSNRYGDTILHSFAHKKEPNQMKWALESYGKELIYKPNNSGNNVLHELFQKEGNNTKEETVKIIEMLKQFLGKRFKGYVNMKNNYGQTAFDLLAKRFQSSQEIIEALENNNITHTLRVTFDSKQQKVVRPPPSDSHGDTLLAISFYKGNLSLCKWWMKYFGNNKNEVTNTNTNIENAFHQLFREDVNNSIRQDMINILRTHILSKWDAGTYTDMIGQENKFGKSVLSSAIEYGGDVNVVRELLTGISPSFQSEIIQKQNEYEESPLSLAFKTRSENKQIFDFLNDIIQKEHESATEELEQPINSSGPGLEQGIDTTGLEFVNEIFDNLKETGNQEAHVIEDEETSADLKEKIAEKEIETLKRRLKKKERIGKWARIRRR